MVVVRKDLPFGQMIAQSGHAIADFSIKNKEFFEKWHDNSNYLIILEIPSENHLKVLSKKLKARDANVVEFYEPDIGDQLTSICFFGTPEMRKITNKLKLALS